MGLLSAFLITMSSLFFLFFNFCKTDLSSFIRLPGTILVVNELFNVELNSINVRLKFSTFARCIFSSTLGSVQLMFLKVV